MLSSLIKISSGRQLLATKFPDGTTVYYSLLNHNEISLLLNVKEAFNISDNEFYEEVYNICASPEWKDIGGAIKAGVPHSIGEYIVYQSKNYDNIEEEIEKARLQYNSEEIYEHMKIVVMAAAPSYTFEILDALDRISLVKLFTRCENLLSQKTEGAYKPVNTKHLRKQEKQGIDFDKENRELRKTGPIDAPSSGNEMLQLKANAKARHERRLEKIHG